MRSSVTRVVTRTYRNADGTTYTERVQVSTRPDATLRSTSGGKPMRRSTMSPRVMTQFRPGASATYDLKRGERWTPKREEAAATPRRRTARVQRSAAVMPDTATVGIIRMAEFE